MLRLPSCGKYATFFARLIYTDRSARINEISDWTFIGPAAIVMLRRPIVLRWPGWPGPQENNTSYGQSRAVLNPTESVFFALNVISANATDPTLFDLRDDH
jgi:hypothetical protein